MEIRGIPPLPGAGGSFPASSPFLELQQEISAFYQMSPGSDSYNQQVTLVNATISRLEKGNSSPVYQQAVKNISEQFNFIVQLTGSNKQIEQDILRIQNNPPMTPVKAAEIASLDGIMARNSDEINTGKKDIGHDFALLMSTIIS